MVSLRCDSVPNIKLGCYNLVQQESGWEEKVECFLHLFFSFFPAASPILISFHLNGMIAERNFNCSSLLPYAISGLIIKIIELGMLWPCQPRNIIWQGLGDML